MSSNVIQAIPASQIAQVNPGILPAGSSPLQFWGLIVDDNVGANGYPLLPIGEVTLFSSETDVNNYFGASSQEAGLANVYFTGPVNAQTTPSGLLMVQYALNAVPAYLRGGSTALLSLAQLQTINASLTVVIDGGSPVTATVNLSTATSFSNAAELIGAALGAAAGSTLHGVQKGTFQASLSGTTMTVSALTAANSNGPAQATVTANLVASGNLMNVTSITGGYLAIGQVVTGTGLSAGTTIASYSGTGQPGGVGTYVLSAAPSNGTAIVVTAFAAAPVIALGDIVTGTGIPSNTYVSAFLTGTGGAGTYTLSNALTSEAAETILQYAPICSYSPLHNSFNIHSGTTGVNSSVAFATGAGATALNLTQATGAIQSLGAAASSPATFMTGVTALTQNWVSFMTTWEPTDVDKSTAGANSFAGWNNAQGNGYRYCMWETNVADTTNSPSAAVAAINSGNYSGTVMIYTNPAITTLSGEKAAFSMSWAASLAFTQTNGRQTAAFKAYVGGLADVMSGAVAINLAGSPQAVAINLAGSPQTGTFGNGVNFYGSYTTRSQGFLEWQRGLISGPFDWDDTYTDQIWLNNALQNAIMVGLAAANSVPYNGVGAAQIESWCLDPILAGINFGAIVSGVTLSQAQIQDINQATGVDAASVIVQRGWYLQVKPASATIRGNRTSPPCTFYWSDGGSVHSVDLSSITVQ